MDISVRNKSARESKGGPIIVFANWFQFGAFERTIRPFVESRMLLWCVSGAGNIWVNGEKIGFEINSWVLLPWQHEIIYEPDVVNPFFVGGIHIIPWHSRAPVEFQVAHHKGDPLAGSRERCNQPWPHMDKLVTGHFASGNDRLALLATYTVERFQHSPPARESMSTLAKLLIDELQLIVQARPAPTRPRPTALRQMQVYAEAHINRVLTMADLSQVAGCSEASVHRLFRSFESKSPVKWMAGLRARRAAFLLRTTKLPIWKVGEQLGMTDPFHFSRFFKREFKVSPRAYRKDSGSI